MEPKDGMQAKAFPPKQVAIMAASVSINAIAAAGLNDANQAQSVTPPFDLQQKAFGILRRDVVAGNHLFMQVTDEIRNDSIAIARIDHHQRNGRKECADDQKVLLHEAPRNDVPSQPMGAECQLLERCWPDHDNAVHYISDQQTGQDDGGDLQKDRLYALVDPRDGGYQGAAKYKANGDHHHKQRGIAFQNVDNASGRTSSKMIIVMKIMKGHGVLKRAPVSFARE